MASHIKLLLFDLGNVVFKIDSSKTFDYWNKLSSIPNERLKELFFSGDEYNSYELGETSEERFRRNYSKKIGFNITKNDFTLGLNLMILGIFEGIKDILDKLKGKYYLAVLSNTNITHERFILQKYTSILTTFDKLFLSHRIKCRKPEKKVFEIVINHFKVSPSEVIFFDDVSENIVAANEFGINAFLIDSDPIFQINKILKDFGVF